LNRWTKRERILCFWALFFLATVWWGGCGKGPTKSEGQKGPAASSSGDTINLPTIEYKPQIGTPGGYLIDSSISNPKSFNPIIAQETSTTALTQYIFEGLTRLSGITNEPMPALAKSWEVSGDGLTWTIHLRDDVKWNDGHPFTADDVVFTYRQLVYNKDIPSSSRDIFTIEGKEFEVNKVSDHTVVFKTPSVFAPFLRGLTQEILPKHKLEESVKNGTFNSTWGVDSKLEEIVGTGPFMLERYEPSQRVVFKRNPLYWDIDARGNKLPYLDGLIVLIVPNIDVSLLKFQDGETDFYGLRGSDFPILKPLEQEKAFTIYRVGPALGTNFIVFNQNPGINPQTKKPYLQPVKLKWFTNAEFRKAVAYALDRQGMIDLAMNGLAYPQHASISPSSGYFHSPNVKKYEYDPEKAKAILAAAGFKDTNRDGYIEDAAGNKVEFNLFTNAENNVRVKLADIIRKDLEGVGMQVHFTPLEFNNLVDKMNSTMDWDCILLGLTGGPEPHFAKNVWHSSGQLHLWNPREERPATAWEARIDQLFDAGVKELDNEKRKALYDEWQLIVSEQLPVIYTVLPDSIFAVRNKFGNLHPTVLGGAFHNIEEIYVLK
jgi:peptide/nickel transport system substrate-binding protein